MQLNGVFSSRLAQINFSKYWSSQKLVNGHVCALASRGRGRGEPAANEQRGQELQRRGATALLAVAGCFQGLQPG